MPNDKTQTTDAIDIEESNWGLGPRSKADPEKLKVIEELREQSKKKMEND